MKLRIFVLSLALAACSGPSQMLCCPEPTMERDVAYAGTSPTGALVSVRVRSDGTASITWIKGGTDVVQQFQQQF